MFARSFSRLGLPVVLAMLACAGCGERSDRPAPPEMAEPAAAPTMTPAEDRGQQESGAAPAPSSDEHAFSNVDSGEAERAASKRGHESAGESAPAPVPGSGG